MHRMERSETIDHSVEVAMVASVRMEEHDGLSAPGGVNRNLCGQLACLRHETSIHDPRVMYTRLCPR
jgi:hypothetical protein